jgi:phosphoribosylaminoimidazolecarboxamide formyltransferase/IMP cyclohydrolase
LLLRFDRKQTSRCGENPHQAAAFYAEPGCDTLCQHGGRAARQELSYNNLLDLDSAFNLVREFDRPTAAVIKHNNPCGRGRRPSKRHSAKPTRAIR